MKKKTVDEVLTEAWATMTYREREMLKLKFGLGEHMTYTNEEIGHVLGIGAERVRQLLKAACKKLDEKTKSVRPTA
jgi:RNA polymerase primary sigma factor